MRKLNRANPPSKEYGPVVLWADDLDELIATLKVCESTLFVADDIQYDSVEEFVRERNGRTPRKVRVSGERPYIGIELYPLWAKLDVSALSVSKDELLSLGLFKKLDTILSRCERRPRWVYKQSVLLGLAILTMAASWLPLPNVLSYANAAATILILGWMMSFASHVHLRKYSVVRPHFIGDAPGFFQRNKDSIVVAVVSALIGSLFGAVATKAVDKVWPSVPSTTIQDSANTARPSPRDDKVAPKDNGKR